LWVLFFQCCNRTGECALSIFSVETLDGFIGCPQEFGGTRILGGFPKNHQFGPERSHSLSLQQQVAQVL